MNNPDYEGCPYDAMTDIKDISEKEKLLKKFPNPAAGCGYYQLLYTHCRKGEATSGIINNISQVVHSQMLPMYNGFQKMNVANYTSGAYSA